MKELGPREEFHSSRYGIIVGHVRLFKKSQNCLLFHTGFFKIFASVLYFLALSLCLLLRVRDGVFSASREQEGKKKLLQSLLRRLTAHQHKLQFSHWLKLQIPVDSRSRGHSESSKTCRTLLST